MSEFLDWFRQLEAEGGCDDAQSPLCAETAVGNKGKWRTPILRNVAETGPYFHNGNADTLRDVVEFYNNPPTDNSNGHSDEIDPQFRRPLGLTEDEIDDVVAFMETLTGVPPENVAPVGVR